MQTTRWRLAIAGTLLAPMLAIYLLHAGDAPKTGPATEKRFPPLKVPAGFKATLFACDPLIEYPSVISIGPKPGAIFVAVDYMTGLERDGKVKSEIRLVEDTNGDGYADKATTIAKGFNSIQGLAYHDGTLFVMHAPYLTTLRMPSPPAPLPEGEGRKDVLSGLGLKPEDNQSRLHSANGVVVGHDGWLYLAHGDNGVNVPRPEGDRLIHNGGAILRCRPDGRDLHLFSTGLRNIYDIALDADLNVFTRDNENDGGTYMIRAIHSFFGADHGYPYDYYERPDHAMKPIGDFGLGSSAGGVCYLETQFPREYRGNLFFGEWGKSVVRYDLKRQGSGFSPVKEVEFASGDPKDGYPFKPTDVVVQRDGTMMVADYADGQRPKRGRGRIYHVKYVGQDSDLVIKQPKSELDKLNSPSYFDRWEAQIAFERRGDAGRQELGDAFRANKLGPLGMNHALHALSKGGKGTGLGDMLALVTDPDPVTRIPAIRIIADLTDPVLVKHKLDAGRGDVEIAKTLATLKKRDDPRVLLEITIALSRLRWAGAPEWIAKNVTKPDDALAHAAMQTLRRADNWPAVLKLLDQEMTLLPEQPKGLKLIQQYEEKPTRTIAMRAVTDQYDPMVVDGLIDRLNSAWPNRRRDYAEALARVYKKPGPWKYWGYRPGPRPANTVAWEKTDAIAKALNALLADPDFDVRFAVLKSMEREKMPTSAAKLGEWLASDYKGERADALIAALGRHTDSAAALKHLHAAILNYKSDFANRLAALDVYFKILGPGPAVKDELLLLARMNKKHGPVQAELVRRLGQIPNAAPTDFFLELTESGSPEVLAAAIEALGNQRAKEGPAAVVKFLRHENLLVRRAAATAAGKLEVTAAVEPLLKLATEPDLELRLACLESLRQLRDPRVLKLAAPALNVPSLELKALTCIAELGGPADAKSVIDHAKHHPSTEVVAVAVRAFAGWRDRVSTAEMEKQALDRGIAEIHGAAGILVHWDVSVPYNPGGRDGIVKAMGIPGKRTKFWRPQFAQGAEGRLTLDAVAGAGRDVRYLFSDLAVASETPIEFLASSRSTLDVWLNGKSIHRRAMAGKFQIDSDRFAGTLRPGMNRILVDTGAADVPVEFHLRFRRKSSKAAHEKLTQAALTRSGNAERGRRLFADKQKSQCMNCHQLSGQGERIGPELTGVGARFSRIYLVESILEPSRTIAPSFGTLAVTLKNGKVMTGVKIAENEMAITLADNQGQKHVLAKRDIDEQNASAVSTMPEGLELRLTEDEFVDLIAFLASQKDQSLKR